MWISEGSKYTALSFNSDRKNRTLLDKVRYFGTLLADLSKAIDGLPFLLCLTYFHC